MKQKKFKGPVIKPVYVDREWFNTIGKIGEWEIAGTCLSKTEFARWCKENGITDRERNNAIHTEKA